MTVTWELVPGRQYAASSTAFAGRHSQLLCPAEKKEKEESQWVAGGAVGGMGFT